ncbi:MAG TPA: sigma-70 family RNA polymerase sigma factor, partial [Ktedonobacterales bacterium]|nr:sigma-70 family RNA polymerase sigma factor [Ktedonobacterales bacterium]
ILNNAGTSQDVEECVSDLFVSVWHEYDAFDPKRGSLRTWLTMRAKYLALDRRRYLLRKQAATIALSAFDLDSEATDGVIDGAERIERQRAQEYWTADSLESMLERHEDHARLHEALARLSETDRHLVYMRYFQLASTEEMATQTGLSRHAIDTRIWRARKQLKEALWEPIHGRV